MTDQAEIVSPYADGDERIVEAALRPKRLDEFIGQHRVREQLTVMLDSARDRGRPPDHVLLSGPPGLGKTTMAMIIAAELGAPLRVTSGPAIERAGDLAALLSTLSEGEVLFLDEIHRMARPAEEMLYVAMEDFRVDVVVGKGPGATAIPLDVSPFTLVGATTRAGLLPGPLRDRFGFVAHLDFYEPADLQRVIERSARLLDVPIDHDAIAEIAGRSRGTPRIANRLLRGSATSRRCGPAGRSPAMSPATRSRSTTSTSGVSTGSTGPSSTLCCAASTGDRSASRPSPSRSARSRRPSRRSPSRSSSGPGCSPARPGGGWRQRPPGATSACGRPRRGAWSPRCSPSRRSPTIRCPTDRRHGGPRG